MKISFKVNAPPYSVNKAYYKNRQLTRECRQWRENFLLQLQDPEIQKSMAKIKDKFDAKKHSLSVCYHFFYPKSTLLTKSGVISKRSMDLTNIEKLVQDNIFEERYNGRVIHDTTISNLNIDDKFITALYSTKNIGDSHYILIEVEILSLLQVNPYYKH